MPGRDPLRRRVGTLARTKRARGTNLSAHIEAGMAAMSDPRAVDVDPKYYYRRSLKLRELAPAFGAAIAVAAVTFYITKLFLERTPLGSR